MNQGRVKPPEKPQTLEEELNNLSEAEKESLTNYVIEDEINSILSNHSEFKNSHKVMRNKLPPSLEQNKAKSKKETHKRAQPAKAFDYTHKQESQTRNVPKKQKIGIDDWEDSDFADSDREKKHGLKPAKASPEISGWNAGSPNGSSRGVHTNLGNRKKNITSSKFQYGGLDDFDDDDNNDLDIGKKDGDSDDDWDSFDLP